MSFNEDIKRFQKKTDDRIDKVIRMAFIEASTRIIRRSPVGDANFWKGKPPKGYTGGRFRANWQASVNKPATGAIDTSKRPKTRSSIATGSVVSAASKRKARSYYLMNNLPYSTAIEQGHSRQAPNGIIKLVAAEWKQIVRLTNSLVK